MSCEDLKTVATAPSPCSQRRERSIRRYSKADSSEHQGPDTRYAALPIYGRAIVFECRIVTVPGLQAV